MFLVGERVDGGDLGVVRKLFHVLLGEGAEDRAVAHAAHDARHVFDGFTAAKLDFMGGKENDLPA